MVETWQRIEPTVISQIDRRVIVTKTFVFPDGRVYPFSTFNAEGRQSVATIALTAEHKVIIARQFRPGPERIMEEIPGGAVELDEDIETGARRELLEETGYQPGSIEYLGESCRDAYSNARSHYFFATDCILTEHGQELDPEEYIEVALLSIEEFIVAAKNNAMSDAAAVLMAYDKLKSYIGS
jgi:ADP-ribose pyrophosphatase